MTALDSYIVEIRREKNLETVGTGFVISNNGIIVTAHHVVCEALGVPHGTTLQSNTNIPIHFHQSGVSAQAKVLQDFQNIQFDVIIIQSESIPEGINSAVLSLSSDTKNHPFNSKGYRPLPPYQGPLASGEILGHIDIPGTIDAKALQLRSREINLGMSGAPVEDATTGLVVGMINAIWKPGVDSADLARDALTAFAISTEAIKQVYPTLQLIDPSSVLEPDGYYSIMKKLREARDRLQKSLFSGHEFYNGTEPSWLNIAANHDAKRDIHESLKSFVEEHINYVGKIPLALIIGRAGDGKSTVLMRLAASLVDDGYVVYWHKEENNRLESQQIEYLSSGRRIILCIDDVTRFPIEEIEGFFRSLHKISANMIIIVTARESLWFGQQPAIETIANIEKFSLITLSDNEIKNILDKLTDANELGELRYLNRDGQEEKLKITAERQLLVAMLEAKYGMGFVDIVRRNIRDIETKFGSKAAEACFLVSAVHTFGIEFPPQLLANILQINSIDADILAKTKGFLINPRIGIYGLRTRHAVIASVVFDNDPGCYDRLATFVYNAKHSNSELFPSLIYSIRLQFRARNLKIEKVRVLFKYVSSVKNVQKYILNNWALLEKSTGNCDEARRLFRQATEADPKQVFVWQPWAIMEKELGNHDEARRLFKKATEADSKNALGWQAWAIMEKELNNYDEARRLFQKAIDADSKDAHGWQAWAIMEKELNNYDEARRLFSKSTEADPRNSQCWQPWAIMEKELNNYDEARRLFRKATEADPRSGQCWQPWAIMEKELNNYDEARRLFRQATQADPEHAQSWQAWAIMEKELKNYDEARRLFKQATQADPEHAQSWQAWAIMEKELKNYDEARCLFKQATQADPKHAPSWQPWAIMEKELENYDEARRLFRQATQADPKDALSWQSWAIMEKELGSYEEARRLFREATKANPKRSDTWQPWAIMEKELGNYEGARRLFGEATKANPKRSDTWQPWAIMEKELANYERARRLFIEATKADPRSVFTWQPWAIMEKELGNYEEARRLFGEATKADPKRANSWQPWAIMEKELGNFEEARRLFIEAIKADPKHVPAWQAWAIMEKELGNYEEARRLFAEAAKADPRNTAVWQPWAIMENDLGNFDEAFKYAQRAVELKPRDFYPYIARGEVYFSMKNFNNSKSDFEQAKQIIESRLKHRPNDTRLLYLYGKVLSKLGQYQQAENVFRRSLNISPIKKKAFAHDGLGVLYEAKGMFEEAIKEWQKALEYLPHFLPAKNNIKRVQQLLNKESIGTK